jgi:hypothetical protein
LEKDIEILQRRLRAFREGAESGLYSDSYQAIDKKREKDGEDIREGSGATVFAAGVAAEHKTQSELEAEAKIQEERAARMMQTAIRSEKFYNQSELSLLRANVQYEAAMKSGNA